MIPAAQEPRGAIFRAGWARGYRMGRLDRVRGEQAWLALAVLIVAYEVRAADGELLSEAVDRLLVSHPVLTRAAIALVALHLANAINPKFDPLHLLAVALRRRG
ncbi:hypothetical protein GS534_24505 [Rhodococcus hoagii]|nr:hypothetical protein [Prescottella equi]